MTFMRIALLGGKQTGGERKQGNRIGYGFYSCRSEHPDNRDFLTFTLSHFIGFHNFRSTQPTLYYSLVVAGCSLERLSN